MANVLEALREAGVEEQVAALTARDPATHAPLDDPIPVVCLLKTLRKLGDEQRVAVLTARAAAQAPSTTRAPPPICWM